MRFARDCVILVLALIAVALVAGIAVSYGVTWIETTTALDNPICDFAVLGVLLVIAGPTRVYVTRRSSRTTNHEGAN